MNTTVVLFVFIAYLLGSIPTSVWLGKLIFKKDIRDFGSGNAGATNTFRTFGIPAGIVVLLIDVLKGFFACKLIHFIPNLPDDQIINVQLILGIAAVVGHIFPVYVKFKGGKGIATLLGMLLAITPYAAIGCILVFLLVLFSTRYVSLSSMIAAISFPLIIIFVLQKDEMFLVIFAVVASLGVLITHRKNIQRLLKGTESKAKLFKK